jgi:5-methylcytosine-specific restriction endonuclease McrA
MKRHVSLKNYRCVYCGARGNTVDHVPPKNGLRPPDMVVRACHECNSNLGNRILLDTIQDRAAFLRDLWATKKKRINPWREKNLSDVAKGLSAIDVPDY